jgi:anoctamin-10
MIVAPKEDGGAAITPKTGQWKCVESIFPLHDHQGNKEWLKAMGRKTFLSPNDLDHIRNNLGAKVINCIIY